MKIARKIANFRFVRKYIYILLFMAVSPVVCFGEPARLKSLMSTQSWQSELPRLTGGTRPSFLHINSPVDANDYFLQYYNIPPYILAINWKSSWGYQPNT
jgi:hypothetical protein